MGKRILVCGYFAGNLGDDLFLKVLFDRYPHVQWDLLTANRNYNKIFKDYKNVKIIYTYREVKIGKIHINPFFKVNELFFKYKKYDAFVNIGGSIFMQSLAWKIRLRERIYLVDAFKKMNKKSFILGANFGPFTEGVFFERYRSIFPNYDDICFRDHHSYRLFRDLDNVRMAPDVVFTLDVNHHRRQKKSVAFSIIDLEGREGLKDYYHQYNEKIISLSEEYIKQGYRIKFFSFCESEGDLKVSQKIKDEIKCIHQHEIEVISYTGNLGLFLKEFKTCEIVIGTRFHSIILAMINNQSFYPFIYNEKTFNMLRDLNKSKVYTYIKDINTINVKNLIDITFNNKLHDKKVFENANKQFEKLDLFLV